jgi:uncharacterized protein (DUF1684 family)
MNRSTFSQLFAAFLLFIAGFAAAQPATLNAIEDIKKFQDELDQEYRDPAKSPLGKDGSAHFEGHEFFPIDLKFRVTAKLKVTNSSPFFQMKTTGPRINEERVYGILEFTLGEKNFQLPVYQSARLMKTQEYKDYLFLPFTDLTNGTETYDAGRYIDLRIPEGQEIVVDFNKAYNPYCAYVTGYSCPIVPKENHLETRITAGIMHKEHK